MIVSSLLRRTAALVIGAGIVAAPLAVASPASAAPNCGLKKTARTSIHYQVCAQKTADGNYNAMYYFGNNHGSRITITTQWGWETDGSRQWSSGTQTLTLRAEPGLVHLKTNKLYCGFAVEKNKGILRVKENDGTWGVVAFSKTVDC
ncbi:hypothetical protein [Actinoplanes sp. DH11]|uniref:hypothetical protein n=1 Tax=Actinoplanes sp. DH11 TaxID=2857011 RepID=UPI001E459663|nr:hypothetical protein [Actinoplanes sp. DH11]